MREITLGRTGITVPQNAFGALPIQRVPMADAVQILRSAYEGGMRYFDTARAYTDSEEKLGEAFTGMRDKIYIATKTQAKTPEKFREDLDTSLKMLRTDYIDVYQFHMMSECWRPGDGSGMYECMLEAKKQGKIRHISGTAHKLDVAFEIAKSGLYETLQFPFSYLAGEKEHELVRICKENNVGFIAMKGLAGGLANHSDACMAFMLQFDNVLPIWGIQKQSELDEWISYMDNPPSMTPEMTAFIEKERKELRTSLMLRRAPSSFWLSPKWQAEMMKIEDCVNCGLCSSRCPYELDTPALLRRNLEDYKEVLAGRRKVQ